MKKVLFAVIFLVSFSSFGQQGYRYSIVPGFDNTYTLAHKEIKAIPYASTKTVAPTMEETVYDFAQLTGAITVSVTVTPCYTGDRMTCLFKADGSDRVVTFSTGFSAVGTMTVVAASKAIINFVFNGVSWIESTRQNLVSGSVTSLLAGNGSVGSPSIAFTSSTGLGLYRIGSNNAGFSANGAKVLDIATTGLGVTGTTSSSGQFLGSASGSAAAPSYAITGVADMGMYSSSGTELGFSASGTFVARMSTALGLEATAINATAIGGTTPAAGDFTNLSSTGALVQKHTSTAYTATGAITAAELAGGLITITSGTDTLTLPTATLLATELGAGAGSIFDFTLQNSASGGTALLAVNTGIVVASAVTGGDDLSLANSATAGIATFRITFISATVATISRIN